MSYCSKTKALESLLEKIIAGNTGPAEDLSKRIFVTVPTFHRYLLELRELGHEIEYSRSRQSYILIKK